MGPWILRAAQVSVRLSPSVRLEKAKPLHSLEGEGGESAIVQDYGDTVMQEVGKQSIQGVGR